MFHTIESGHQSEQVSLKKKSRAELILPPFYTMKHVESEVHVFLNDLVSSLYISVRGLQKE